MTSRKFLMILPLAIFGLVSSAGCIYDCDDVDIAPVESGDYIVTNQAFGPEEQQWLIGAQFTVDREMEVLILRYTRDGTTYEARYTLEP